MRKLLSLAGARRRFLSLWSATRQVLSVRGLLQWIGWWEGLAVAVSVIIASATALTHEAPWVMVGIFSPLAFVFVLMTWRGVALWRAERQRARSRLQLGSIGGSVRIPPGIGYEADTVSLTNVQQRFPNTCHGIRANLTFTFKHTGEKRRVAGMFVRTDGQTITSEPVTTISLEMLESVRIATLVRNTLNQNFVTFSKLPFDAYSETRLEFGEWILEVSVTSDNEDDSASAEYSLQLNPTLSSEWTPMAVGRG
jgi:hypothetical protein